MTLKSLIHNKTQASISVFLITLVFLLWEYFNGGVVSHNLLAREDLPAFSNWWGLLTVPLLFWISISLINRRGRNRIHAESEPEIFETTVLKRFLAALGFGLLMSILWEFNYQSVLQYLILIPILLSFFKPVHLPEYLMGFALGMLFTFGGVLPILFGTVLLILCFLVNWITNLLRKIVSSKTEST